MPRRFVLLLCFAALALRAFALNGEGHMIVAQIAYNHLNPEAKRACDELIAVPLSTTTAKGEFLSLTPERTNTFITAAVWADDFRKDLHTAAWHFIDIPLSLDGTTTAGVPLDSFDAVRAIKQSESTLQSAAASKSERATSLRYLLHLVGDVHQPLHCCTAVSAAHPRGDYGGNDFALEGEFRNLHECWDDGGGFLMEPTGWIRRPLSPADLHIIMRKAAALEAEFPYAPNQGVLVDPMIWAREGYELDRTVVYAGVTPGAEPSQAYLDMVQSISRRRIAQAGHRLADVLNTIFPARAAAGAMEDRE